MTDVYQRHAREKALHDVSFYAIAGTTKSSSRLYDHVRYSYVMTGVCHCCYVEIGRENT